MFDKWLTMNSSWFLGTYLLRCRKVKADYNPDLTLASASLKLVLTMEYVFHFIQILINSLIKVRF